jgi:hypothetical protein
MNQTPDLLITKKMQRGNPQISRVRTCDQRISGEFVNICGPLEMVELRGSHPKSYSGMQLVDKDRFWQATRLDNGKAALPVGAQGGKH